MSTGNSPASSATLRIDGGTLHIAGRLQRDAVPALWAALPSAANGLANLAQIDLTEVTALDTAGLAFLVEIAIRSRHAGGAAPGILNVPAGYDALCAAYRIRPQLDEVASDDVHVRS